NAKNKRMACVECRQQKSKCDAQERAPLPCTRCTRRNLICSLQSNYKRTYKRARLAQMEKQFNDLKLTLQKAGITDLLLNNNNNNNNNNAENQNQNENDEKNTSLNSELLEKITSLILNSTNLINKNNSNLSNISTASKLDESSVPAKCDIILTGEILKCEPKSLGEIELSSLQISEFYQEYTSNYYPILPIIDIIKGPEKLYRLCPVLFWVIMSVAMRRISSDSRKLLLKLTPHIKSILADLTISPITRYSPSELDEPVLNASSVYSVQAFLIYTFWSSLTSSLSADSSWNTIGIAIFQAIRIGLHSPGHTIDFSNASADSKQLDLITEQIKTWTSCNVVSQTIATTFGYPAFVQFDSRVLNNKKLLSTNDFPQELNQMLEISYFENQIAKTLNSNFLDPLGLVSNNEKLSLIQILLKQLNNIEIRLCSNDHKLDDIRKFSLLAAKVHLLTYYFLDSTNSNSLDDLLNDIDPSSNIDLTNLNSPYSSLYSLQLKKGLIKLYNSTILLINHTKNSQNNNRKFIKYLPNIYLIEIWQAAIILCKIVHSPISKYIDTMLGRSMYDIVIYLTLKSSIVKYDIAYRFAGIMKSLWKLFETLYEKGTLKTDVAIKTRMAASIFFDCLWTLREKVGMIKYSQKNNVMPTKHTNEDSDVEDEKIKLSTTSLKFKESNQIGTPNSLDSNAHSKKSTKSRSIADPSCPETSARKIINKIPLDPDPIKASVISS
ncbi:leucine-responsive transcriptional regulator LEU3 ASCRUDRAFT_25996, partial [Ascoidea rubescens DSM 1968]